MVRASVRIIRWPRRVFFYLLGSIFLQHFFYHLRFHFPLATTPEYVQVGCFKDMSRQRALPERLASYRGKIDWKTDLDYIVKKCAQEAKKMNYTYFR